MTSPQKLRCVTSTVVIWVKYRHTSFYRTLLHFADIAFFTNWRFVATLHQRSLSAPFFQKHFLTLCLCVTFWSFLQYFKLFYYCCICYGTLQSAIFDTTIAIVLGHHELHPYKKTNLIDKCCICSYYSTDHLSPYISLSLGLPIPWDTIILILDQLITLQWPLSVHVKERVAGLSL